LIVHEPMAAGLSEGVRNDEAMPEVMRPSPIKPTIDLDADGKAHGFLRLPWSHDQSAWGNLMIPITVIKGGEGPTALLTGGNHGDEYEGPIALLKLAKSLAPEDLRGRVIIIPFMNFPAFKAGRRTSPIDGGNLNRSFPGMPDGSITEKIADFFERVLLPKADYVLDFHSGGHTLDFLPFAAAHVLEDKAQEARCIEAMKAFSAPYSMMLLEIDKAGLYDTAAEDQGKIFVSTELGGGGTATAASIKIAERGLDRFLKHAGILEGEPEPSPTTLLDMPDHDCFIFAEDEGVLEMAKDLGDIIQEGALVAHIHNATRTGAEPVAYHAKRSGLLVGRHHPGLIAIGDCLAVIAEVTNG